ncbi:MAG: hypothetical protein DRP87_04880 [Spirochaetes bacterium]|nr:MAG: hypothetical protein DRP87_04880 [Spirochaetota bacterium]
MADSHGTPENSNSKQNEKVYCANCIHCKLVRTPSNNNGNQYYLRVRCSAGKWRKKLGEEKLYKYFTVARRSYDYCDCYEPMGDPRDFLRDLKKSLPIKDEAYTQ